MNKTHIFLLIIAVLLMIIDYSYSLGFLLGCLGYYINYLLLVYKYNNLLNKSKTIMTLITLLAISILGICLLTSFIVPSIFNYWFAFIGMILNRYLLFFQELKGAR